MNLGYNSIFLPGSLEKPFWELVRLGPVPVLWFTPGSRRPKKLVFGMQPYFTQLDDIWKTTSIFSKRKTTSIFPKWKSNSNFSKMEDDRNFFKM
jgi:hypothetical protein